MTNDEIAIWCDDASQVPATVDEMIADGELRETDRPRCVHWAVFPTHRRIIGRSAAECEAAKKSMIASGQASAADRFVFRILTQPINPGNAAGIPWSIQ